MEYRATPAADDWYEEHTVCGVVTASSRYLETLSYLLYAFHKQRDSHPWCSDAAIARVLRGMIRCRDGNHLAVDGETRQVLRNLPTLLADLVHMGLIEQRPRR